MKVYVMGMNPSSKSNLAVPVGLNLIPERLSNEALMHLTS